MENNETTPEEMELTITSDGTASGTTITETLTGKPLFGVSELRLHIKAEETTGTAEIVLVKPKMNLTGKFKVADERGS